MRSHVCNMCNKRLSSYHSLWRHKRNNICRKGEGSHIPIPAKIRENKEELNRILNTCDSPATTKNQELDSDSEKEDSDTEGDVDDDALWEKFAMSCNRGGIDILERLKDIIDLYIWSQNDELFDTIMDDMMRAKNLGYSSADASDFAVYKNKTAIIDAVEICDDEDVDVFWCVLSHRDVQDGCLWFTGEDCYCDECKGTSLLTKVAVFVKMFYAMAHDEIIQKIVKEGDITESIQRHREEILDQYRQAQNLIEAFGIIDDPDRPKFRGKTDSDNEPHGSGMYLNPYTVQ